MADDDRARMIAEIVKKRLVYPVPDLAEIEILRNVIYKTVEDSELEMDVYLPEKDTNDDPVPGVLFIHGGPLPAGMGPPPKDWGVFVSYGELMAASGLVGITFNHRFGNLTDLEQSAADVRDAVDYVRKEAESFRLDPERLSLWAFSGGGPHLAPYLRERPPYLRCLVAYYTVLDPSVFKQMESLGPLVSGELDEETLAKFSASLQLEGQEPPLPPILVARAGLDHPAINQSIDEFCSKALETNLEIDLLTHPKGHHGFEILDDLARTHEILGRTLELIKQKCG